jgi:hypothetical protein
MTLKRGSFRLAELRCCSITQQMVGQTDWLELSLSVRIANFWGNNPSAKQNNAFCFFFWKKKNFIRVISTLIISFPWGHAPKPAQFREFEACH